MASATLSSFDWVLEASIRHFGECFARINASVSPNDLGETPVMTTLICVSKLFSYLAVKGIFYLSVLVLSLILSAKAFATSLPLVPLVYSGCEAIMRLVLISKW